MSDVPFVENLAGYAAAAEFVSSVSISFARRHHVLGVSDDAGHALLAIGDPQSLEQIQIISHLLDRPLSPLLAPPQVVLAAINDAYQQRTGQAQAMIETLDRTEVLQELA